MKIQMRYLLIEMKHRSKISKYLKRKKAFSIYQEFFVKRKMRAFVIYAISKPHPNNYPNPMNDNPNPIICIWRFVRVSVREIIKVGEKKKKTK